ncbi:MAG: hypothetical protein M5U01_05390 [Ardenticatenaceae bacterium]|nr:hypothetical protein [Ardenticatenaceae bacterium]HBY98765.1 hypothetical protein [Chloroflexota bacterium]
MDDDLVTEILAAHADRLAAGETGQAGTFLALFPARAADLEPLLRLAEDVARLLRPVYVPDPTFRAELKGDLLAQHHQARATFWGWDTGRTLAAVGVGSAAVAVAGLIVYWRGRHATPPA